MIVLIFAGIGAVVGTFVGWLLTPPKPETQLLRVRVAANDETVIVALKLGDDVTFLQMNR